MNSKTETLIQLQGLTKAYHGNVVLNDVSFDLKRGEIHGLIGENGAGKSTLIKIISGAIEATAGDIVYKNEKTKITNPHDAIEKGVGVVYQEFNLFPNLTVYENIFFGRELKFSSGILDRKQMMIQSKKIINQLGFDFDVLLPVKRISTAYQQIVEIAKCINHDIELLIMDEPSAPLTESEVEDLFKVVKTLNQQGVTVLYISHKLSEILYLTDRITVLRDGQYITTLNTTDTYENELIRYMVGREIEDIYPDKVLSDGQEILRVEALSNHQINDASFTLHRGEVLGFGGLVGAGRTELARLIFGADKKQSGNIYINQQLVDIQTPMDGISQGIGLIPEDRKLHGLILNKSIYFNALLPSLQDYLRKPWPVIDFKKSQQDISNLYDLLNIKAVDLDQKVQYLSGGNQQKVVLEKWLLKDCDILILDEPTRGIDVGAKEEIYELIKDLASKGKSIILISSEMGELIGLSHRILVMHEGRITGELSGEHITQEAILKLAS